ncbi:MAG: threonine--tRNA ligase [Bacilli bacterium]|nr:threonine--tRNA ligase [Bacilli bacterium]
MINFKEDEKLYNLNHSCAHMMAQAIKHIWPEAKFWVGPVIETGFYYDVDLGDKVITDEDLPIIEKEMKKLAKDGKRLVRHELTKEEALDMFKDDPYKIDLIERMDEDNTVISCYTQGDFTDLCRGGHVDTLKECKNFKLLKFSGAYWKGDTNNKVLQRIYGVCLPTAEELEAYLQELEEAKERDHRKIGKDLGIYMISDLVGRGLPMYLPNGFTLWNLLETYIRDKEIKRGYLHVQTPPLGNVNLYKTSGHLEHYKDAMFPIMQVEDEEYVLRPMNCPHHMVMYGNDIHSYRDLPIRIAEIARDCRYEASGALKGIERVRTFCQNDCHIFCTPEQIEEEFKGVIDLILEVYKELGIKNYRFELSLRDPEDKVKYHQDDEMWNKAEDALRKIMDDLKIPYVEKIGEAAFYGPKCDVQVQPAVGNEITLSTCQIDFCLPMKFDLKYVDKDGEKKTPVVLHRAILGSIDRAMAFYLEETKGNLPLWLAPVQVSVLPVNNEYHLEYANEVVDKLKEIGIRVSLNASDEKLSYRMREEQIKKIPIMLVLGNNERDERTVTLRLHGEEQKNMSLDEFLTYVKEKNDSKALDLD